MKALRPLVAFFELIGTQVILFVETMGGLAMLAADALRWLLRRPYRGLLFFQQMQFVGVGSFFIVFLTGLFTGMVFALQTVSGFSRFNAESLVGGAVALALTREMAPVMAAMMTTARAGSAMAAELGTMRVTEQIDALVTMAVNPVHYLVVPRVVAAVIMVPMLTVVFDLVGMLGAYGVAVHLMGVDEGLFIQNLQKLVEPHDILSGVYKAAVFGFLVAVISCYKGFYTRGGAKGVGQATTQAVVLSSVSIFVADYVLSAFLY